ncbi:MAG: hypothetical protein U0V70_10550 [Terriglobia bacterium]
MKKLNHKRIGAIALFLFMNLVFSLSAFADKDSPTADSKTQKKQASGTANPGSPDDEGWHVGFTPYLWFAGVHGTMGAKGHNASVDASAADVLSHFNIGFMGYADIRHDRIVMPLDFIWIRLKDDKALPIDPAVSAEATMNQTMLTQKLGFRVVNEEKLKIDALAGIRYWHLGNKLTLSPSQFGGEISQSANWVDGVAGAQIQFPLSKKSVFSILGDAGNGGAKLDYQVAGLLGYQVKKAMLQAGWRYWVIDYKSSEGMLVNVTQSGLVLGITFNVK